MGQIFLAPKGEQGRQQILFTHVASSYGMQIFWTKRKFLHNKRVEKFKFELTISKWRRLVAVGKKAFLEKRSRHDKAEKDVMRGYLGMKSYSFVF